MRNFWKTNGSKGLDVYIEMAVEENNRFSHAFKRLLRPKSNPVEHTDAQKDAETSLFASVQPIIIDLCEFENDHQDKFQGNVLPKSTNFTRKRIKNSVKKSPSKGSIVKEKESVSKESLDSEKVREFEDREMEENQDIIQVESSINRIEDSMEDSFGLRPPFNLSEGSSCVIVSVNNIVERTSAVQYQI